MNSAFVAAHSFDLVSAVSEGGVGWAYEKASDVTRVGLLQSYMTRQVNSPGAWGREG